MEVMISPKSIHHLNLLPINTYMDMVSSIVEVKWTMFIITVIRSSETIIKVIEYNSYTLKEEQLLLVLRHLTPVVQLLNNRI